jgi:hypothetical protein
MKPRTVGLPSGFRYDGPEGRAGGLPQQSQDLVGFRSSVLARALEHGLSFWISFQMRRTA